MRTCSETCKDSNGNCPILASDSLVAQCVGSWVKDKYYFLENYLIATKMARKKYYDKGNAVFIDLFAGSGRCVIKIANIEIDNGSLRVLKNQEVPFNEYYMFDICDVNITALSARTATFKNCHTKCVDSNIFVPDLVKTLLTKNFRYHFVYIDPFGPDGLKFNTIIELAKLQRVDLLIHFPIGAIRRNIQSWKKTEYSILDDFMGTQEWRSFFKPDAPNKMLPPLLELYKKQLLSIGFPEDGLGLASGTPNLFPGLSVVPIRNTKSVELYVLILVSKHKIAQTIWNKIIKYSPDGQITLFK